MDCARQIAPICQRKMASHSYALPLLLLCLSLLCISCTSDSAQAATGFIRAKCRKTNYPLLCVQSLSSYATSIQTNPKQLAQTALSVSLERAQFSRVFVTKLAKSRGLKRREYAAIRDCLEQMADSVDRLSDSIRELKDITEFGWDVKYAGVQASVKALTDDVTCMDGFAGQGLNGRIQASVKARMTNVAQLTSNALALFNHFGEIGSNN